MKKKYLGIIISVIGVVGLSILMAMAELLRFMVNYKGISSFIIIKENFLLSFIIIVAVISSGIYLMIKDKNHKFDENDQS